uniref:Putative ovule protein n=1 Tax=Solanum chacoense TaxID=4108 RepID=A0A0V0HNS0_SOLCH
MVMPIVDVVESKIGLEQQNGIVGNLLISFYRFDLGYFFVSLSKSAHSSANLALIVWMKTAL